MACLSWPWNEWTRLDWTHMHACIHATLLVNVSSLFYSKIKMSEARFHDLSQANGLWIFSAPIE